jgi:hypothetical protein
LFFLWRIFFKEAKEEVVCKLACKACIVRGELLSLGVVKLSSYLYDFFTRKKVNFSPVPGIVWSDALVCDRRSYLGYFLPVKDFRWLLLANFSAFSSFFGLLAVLIIK